MTRFKQSERGTPQVRRSYRAIPKTCAASTCRAVVKPGRILCPNHWFFLPEWLRNAVTTTFQAAEWTLHQEAVAQAADYIDAAYAEARERGFDGLMSVQRADGSRVSYMTKVIA